MPLIKFLEIIHKNKLIIIFLNYLLLLKLSIFKSFEDINKILKMTFINNNKMENMKKNSLFFCN